MPKHESQLFIWREIQDYVDERAEQLAGNSGLSRVLWIEDYYHDDMAALARRFSHRWKAMVDARASSPRRQKVGIGFALDWCPYGGRHQVINSASIGFYPAVGMRGCVVQDEFSRELCVDAYRAEALGLYALLATFARFYWRELGEEVTVVMDNLQWLRNMCFVRASKEMEEILSVLAAEFLAWRQIFVLTKDCYNDPELAHGWVPHREAHREQLTHLLCPSEQLPSCRVIMKALKIVVFRGCAADPKTGQVGFGKPLAVLVQRRPIDLPVPKFLLKPLSPEYGAYPPPPLGGLKAITRMHLAVDMFEESLGAVCRARALGGV